MTDSNSLPAGWATAPLSDLGKWIGGGTPSKQVQEYWENGTVHWVSPKDMKRLLVDSAQDQITERAVKESATNLIPANSVLVVTRSGILDHSLPVAVNTIAVAINQDLKAWTPWEGIDPIYGAYHLKARAQSILENCSKDGTTVSSIDFDQLSKYELSIAPAAEQKRIVSKIDELFSRIEEGERALERVQKLVERYRQSVLKAAVTGELTREWREQRKGRLESGEGLLQRSLKTRRDAWTQAELDKMKAKGQKPVNDNWKQKYQEPSPPDTADLPELPTGWEWASLDMLADVVGGITVDQKRTAEDDEAIPYLRVANVQRGFLDLTEIKTIRAPKDRISQLALIAGDILFNEGGDLDKLGRGWIWEGQLARCIHQNHVFRARLFEPGDWNKTISWYCNVMGRKLFMGMGKQTTNLASLSMSKLKGFPVPLMSSLEVEEIVSRVEDILSIVDKQIDELSTLTKASASLKQTILKSAFSGQLAPQDPLDESASALLNRIAAKHESAAPRESKRSPRKTVV